MPRACVIVLDAVGAGELPDAAEFGDEGSNTLANVARAVGGLDLPTLEALGLGNVEPLEGCPPMAGAPAVAGRLIERSKGKDTTLGHWELMGIVTPQALPTYPHGFPFEVIDPFMHRTGRGVLGNRPASGTEIIQELGEQHQETGKWIVYTSADSVFQIAAHEETIPLDEPSGDGGRPVHRRAAFERLDVAEPERLEIGEIESADGFRDVAERVGAFVSELGRVGQLPCADGVQHDDARAGHGAILRGSCTRSSAFSASSPSSSRSSRSRRA